MYYKSLMVWPSVSALGKMEVSLTDGRAWQVHILGCPALLLEQRNQRQNLLVRY